MEEEERGCDGRTSSAFHLNVNVGDLFFEEDKEKNKTVKKQVKAAASWKSFYNHPVKRTCHFK